MQLKYMHACMHTHTRDSSAVKYDMSLHKISIDTLCPANRMLGALNFCIYRGVSNVREEKKKKYRHERNLVSARKTKSKPVCVVTWLDSDDSGFCSLLELCGEPPRLMCDLNPKP